ncbi:MAG TPA: hypothetical protein VGD97_12235 [Lacunisphaera sp.]
MKKRPVLKGSFTDRAMQIAAELSDLLDNPLTHDVNVATGPIGDRWLNMMDRNHWRDTLGRDVAFALLQKFICELRLIGDKAPQLLERFRIKLRDPNRGNYYGTRYEIKIVYDLLRKGEDFRLGPEKGADFLVRNDFGELAIECTSKHLQDIERATTAEQLTRRIYEALEQKAAQAGRSDSAIVCIDITNLGAASLQRNHVLFDQLRTDVLVDEVLRQGVGAVVMHCLKVKFSEQVVEGVGWGYAGIKNPNCTPAVAEYLRGMSTGNHPDMSTFRIPHMP